MLRRCTMTSIFLDDVSGHKLDHAMAKKAREVEMDDFRSMGVYSKVPRTGAFTNGCGVISTRWIDFNKGDDKKPNCRSRLVGKESKKDKRLDLFAATPPLEALKANTLTRHLFSCFTAHISMSHVTLAQGVLRASRHVIMRLVVRLI